MKHTFDPRKAPRVYLLPAISVLLLGGSVVLIVLVQPIVGLIGLVASVWLSFYLIRYTRSQFRSHVHTDDDQLVCLTSLGVQMTIEWAALTHAGAFTTAKGVRYLFVYAEATDELLTIPPYYTRIEALESRIGRAGPDFLELEGETADQLGENLKPFLGAPEAEPQ